MVTRTPPAQLPPARVGPGAHVAINFILRTNGIIRHIRTNAWGDEPLEFCFGDGRLLPALERALAGCAAGDHVTVSVPPDEAYGPRRAELQQRVPAELFDGLDELDAGMCLVAEGEDRRHIEPVMITEVDKEQGTVVVDTNHPLAGMTLEFDVTIVSVRDACHDSGHQPRER